MKGATALDWVNTISRPNSTSTSTMGRSQYFLLRHQELPELFQDSTLGHGQYPREVRAIGIALRVRRPARPRFATLAKRIAADQTPDNAIGVSTSRKQSSG